MITLSNEALYKYSDFMVFYSQVALKINQLLSTLKIRPSEIGYILYDLNRNSHRLVGTSSLVYTIEQNPEGNFDLKKIEDFS